MASSKVTNAQLIADELSRRPKEPMKFGAPAKGRVSELADEYLFQLSFRAIQVARADQLELVSARHVNVALQQIQSPPVRVGWWSRALFAVAGGFASVSASTAINLVTATPAPNQKISDILPSILAVVATGLLALALAILAFFSERWGKRP